MSRTCLPHRVVVLTLFATVLTILPLPGARAAAIYPIDRAEMLAGARFDFRVDFTGTVAPNAYTVTINGKPYADVIGAQGRFVGQEQDSKDQSFSDLRVPGVSIAKPGDYTVSVTAPDGEKASAIWTVYAPAAKPKAKNVILFIGDGMTVANRTAARILSKGIKEGKYLGRLSFDEFPYTALIGTSSVDSIATDSANSMSAYTTGHKGSVNSLGVYASKSVDPFDHPKVETIGEIVKRLTRKSVGIVTDAEIEDATPAGVFAHTRHRREYTTIIDQFLASDVDVLMGGGRSAFLPQSAPLLAPVKIGEEYRRRKDERNLVDEFAARGYAVARTATELHDLDSASAARPKKLLGLFHEGNLDDAMDRHVTHAGTTGLFPDQPDLTQMTRAALDVLSQNKDGFVLMVESGLIDKASHRLDGERSVYNTILLSNAVQVAVDWAAKHKDTLILVTPDHTHPMSLIGTIDESSDVTDARERVSTYEKAKYPNYGPVDAEGYPHNLKPGRHLDIVYGAFPDYYESYWPKADGPVDSATCAKRDSGNAADPTRCLESGPVERIDESRSREVLRTGNLPKRDTAGVHAVDDGILSATGPGAENFHGFMENTEVFKAMVTALGIRDAAKITRK